MADGVEDTGVEHMGLKGLSKKVASKMAAAGWLEPGEEVRYSLASSPIGQMRSGGATTTAVQLGLVTDLFVVRPLQKRVAERLAGDEPVDFAEITDPDAHIAGGELMNTTLTLTDRRLIVHEWKGLGKLGERYGEIPLDGCTIVVANGGTGPAKHRLVHVSGPDGRWVMREVPEMAGGGKRVDEFRSVAEA